MTNTETSQSGKGHRQAKSWTPRTAWNAAEELLAALNQAGITLPTIELEPGVVESPLVSLGRARPDVVKALAAVIRKGAAS